jgi:hypothetical protein
MGERNTRDGRTVYPYRNTDDEHPSAIRDWLDALPPTRGIGHLDAIRDGDDTRSKAIMALAQFKAEASGVRWDAIPWRDEDLGGFCQAWYVSGALWSVDWLLHTGLVVLAA